MLKCQGGLKWIQSALTMVGRYGGVCFVFTATGLGIQPGGDAAARSVVMGVRRREGNVTSTV